MKTTTIPDKPLKPITLNAALSEFVDALLAKYPPLPICYPTGENEWPAGAAWAYSSVNALRMMLHYEQLR